MNVNFELLNKYEDLKRRIASFNSAAVAFSGGVDSTFLLYAANDALKENAAAVTLKLHSVPEAELIEAEKFCKSHGIRQTVIEVNELLIEGFADNPPDRCYICKRDLFGRIREFAKENGINEVIEGSNADDRDDYRPGMKAIKELGILSPLMDVGLSKREIRDLSEHFGIPTWNKQSSACLSSRIPYGDKITEEKLKMAENGEKILKALGFNRLRVRIHGRVARIELDPDEFAGLLKKDTREYIYDSFRKIGFEYVALDILGYRTGSLNEVIHV